MFREFALDPSLIRDWASLDRFVNRFAWAEGRVMSRLPKHWEREAVRSLRVRGAKRTKIVERLRKANRFALERTNIPPESGGNWYTLAKAEHTRERFTAAVSSVNPEGLDWVMRGDDFDSGDALFQPAGQPVSRDAAAFTDSVGLLLRTANRVHLVDPHFQPNERRFRDVIEAFLDVACAPSIYRAAEPELFLHLSLGNTIPLSSLEVTNRTRNLSLDISHRCPSLIPIGHRMRVLVWDQLPDNERIHNRYILTDRAGVIFGIGLDRQDGVGEHESICRLPQDDYAYRIGLYDVTTPNFQPAFNLVSDTTVDGTR